MLILEQTPTRLILGANYRSLIIMQSLVGAFFLLIGLTIVAAFGQLATLECQRSASPQVSCQLTSTGILGKKITHLTALQGAMVRLERVKTTKNYHVVLITQQSEVPLTTYQSTNAAETNKIAGKINIFVKAQQQSLLKIEQVDRWFPSFVFGGAFILVGVLVIVTACYWPLETSFVFDKEMGRLQLRSQWIFGKKIIEQKLDEVAQVQVDRPSIKNRSTTYNLHLLLRSQQQILLPIYDGLRREKVEELANQIRQLLESSR